MKEERNKLPESTVSAGIFWDIRYTMRQIILLIAILIFVTAALVAPSSAAAKANIVITDVTPTELSPGDIKEITLTLKNQGGRDARHITMNFQNSDHISLIGSSTVYISSINAWCSKEIPITIKAEDEITKGAYAIPILVTFSEYYHNASVGYVTTPMPPTNITIVFYVEGTTTLEVADVSTDPPELREESENNNITVLIENFSLKKGITLMISPQADFLVGKVTTEPAVITRCKTFRMNVPIKNIGNKYAKSVKVILKTKSYFTVAKTDYLGDFEVGSDKIVTFELEADRDTIPDNYENDLKHP